MTTQQSTQNEDAAECKPRGIWLRLFCPKDACFSEEERINLNNFCEMDPNLGKFNRFLKRIFARGERSCPIGDLSHPPEMRL